MYECLDRVYGIKGVYRELAGLAYDTVLKTMVEGTKTHPDDNWQEVDIIDHLCHASHHIEDYIAKDKTEDHIAHAITRLVMIKFLEVNHDQANK